MADQKTLIMKIPHNGRDYFAAVRGHKILKLYTYHERSSNTEPYMVNIGKNKPMHAALATKARKLIREYKKA